MIYFLSIHIIFVVCIKGSHAKTFSCSEIWSLFFMYKCYQSITLCEKYPNTEIFSGPYFPAFGLDMEICSSRIWTLFTQWWSSSKNCSCKYSNVHIQVFITQHLPKSITGLTWQVWYVIKPFSVNFTKSSNTQTIHRLPTNCLSVFHHFVGLTLKGLND